MSDTYIKECCPHCKTPQYIWLGTWKMATEAAECYSCGKHFLFGDEKETSLLEILESHFNFVERDESPDDEAYIKIRDALLKGGWLDDPEYGRLDLSGFLKEYAYTERGEKVV